MYQVRLTSLMVVALVDVHELYIGHDSPRFDGRVRSALVRRGLYNQRRSALTKKGAAYAAVVAQFDLKEAKALLDELQAA